MKEHRVAVDDVATRVLEEGSGLAALLLHGGAVGCSAEDWIGLLTPVAAAGFRAIAIDQPGFGACDDPPEVSVAYRARYISGALDALEIERALWVGHSQAGRYVVGTALDAPERMLAGVVLCTGSMLPPLGAHAGGGVPPPAREPGPAETRAYLETVVYDRRLVTDALVAQYQRFSHGRTFACAQRRAAEREPPEPRPAWERLGELRAPVTFVYGAEDGGQVRERILLARERYPQIPFHLIERCGHFAQWDQPATVVSFISEAARSL
jgi:pimeloyl-ACP methyl ester carboxylesterase